MPSSNTGIQWTDRTWNPGVYGCQEVSPGCANCYAATMAYRLERMGRPLYEGLTRSVPAGGRTWTGEVRTLTPGDPRLDHLLQEPFRWRRPSRVFVNSMSDLFHEDVPIDLLARIWAVMALTPWHTYQILTKRPERMADLLQVERFGEAVWQLMLGLPELVDRAYSHVVYRYGVESRPSVDSWPWPPPNVWLGVSVESSAYIGRVAPLIRTPAARRFVSYEPALAAVHFGQFEDGLDWIIIGGESGARARPFDARWAQDLIAFGARTDTAVFVKQLGARWAQEHNRVEAPGIVRSDQHGGNWEAWPEELRVREFPA